MFESFENLFGRKSATQPENSVPERIPLVSPLKRHPSQRAPTFSKVFRWRMPTGQTQPPASVEVAGSFTGWQKVPLLRDAATGSWQLALNDIPSHRTHHYVLLVDGKPCYDKTCDGLARPSGPEEQRFQIETEKGPRVLMLFAQTK